MTPLLLSILQNVVFFDARILGPLLFLRYINDLPSSWLVLNWLFVITIFVYLNLFLYECNEKSTFSWSVSTFAETVSKRALLRRAYLIKQILFVCLFFVCLFVFHFLNATKEVRLVSYRLPLISHFSNKKEECFPGKVHERTPFSSCSWYFRKFTYYLPSRGGLRQGAWVAKERMRKWHHLLYQGTISIPHGKNGRNFLAYIWEIGYSKGREQSFVDERDISHMV